MAFMCVQFFVVFCNKFLNKNTQFGKEWFIDRAITLNSQCTIINLLKHYICVLYKNINLVFLSSFKNVDLLGIQSLDPPAWRYNWQLLWKNMKLKEEEKVLVDNFFLRRIIYKSNTDVPLYMGFALFWK